MTKVLSLKRIYWEYHLAIHPTVWQKQPEDELDISHFEEVYMWLVQRCVLCFLSTLHANLASSTAGYEIVM